MKLRFSLREIIKEYSHRQKFRRANFADAIVVFKLRKLKRNILGDQTSFFATRDQF